MMRRLFLGSRGSAIRSHNLRAILLALLRYEPVSRVRLAQVTQLSNTTITNLIAELLEQGVVAEDAPELNERRAVGRPQTALRLVPDSRYTVGVHFDVDQVRAAVVNLRGQPLRSGAHPHSFDQTPETVLAETAALVERLATGLDERRFIGLGVGVSGLADPATGVNVFAPNLGWRDVPVAEWFSRRFGLPVCLDNNVRAMALGETLFGAGRDAHALAFVYARIGVGAGFVVGGQVYRGSGAGAGEIGHATILPDGGEACRCGNTGCLETLVSEPAILRLAYQLAGDYPGGHLAQALANGQGASIERVFAAARAGDAPSRAMLAERARYMGIALANLVNILNPDLIVLGGLFDQGQDLLLPGVRQTIRERAFAHLGERVELRTATFGALAGVVGAAALAIDAFFYRHETAYSA